MNELLLYGSVGQSFWDEEHFTPAQVRADLKTFTGPVTIRINSGGGIATDGQAIYTALKDYPDAIHVVIDGIAASAASLIAMAGDTITMPIGSIMMIHDPANWFVEGRGTEADHLRSAANLRTLSNAYAKIYAARADIPVEEAREIMRAETYLDGAEALAAGFATSSDDEIEATAFAAFDYGIYDHAPQGLMAVAGARPRAAPRAKVLAMLAGTPPTTTTKPKGKPMAKTAAKTAPKAPAKTTASTKEDQIEAEEDDLMVEDDPEAVDQEDDPTTDTTADAEIDEPDAEEDEVEDDEVEDEPAVARAAAVGVLAYCERNNLPMASARSYISRGLTVAQINAERGGKDKKVRINPHGPRPASRAMRSKPAAPASRARSSPACRVIAW
ncbi:head maturation protease, ClpP-related [Roseicitreum antarcticum]|uniref:head maturation protease, ClpP-related n=1 Tax=Roseicitreum antarcticum TaxID=564137 RepID=UPI001680E071|nr:head maturation protease, ClpP-related [Roseicitreum antarcticum]